MLKDLVLQNRSYRRYHQEVAIEHETLRELVDLARCSASGGNRQPLKYILSCDPEKNALIFPLITLGVGGNPPEGSRPSAYIIILGDTEITKSFGSDHGIAAQSILLGASERGLGGCMIGAIRKDRLSRTLGIPSRYEILLVLSLGKPKEKVAIDTMEPGGDFKYWRDSDGVRYVPKRCLDDIIIG